MVRLVKGLEVRPCSGNGSLVMRDGSSVPLRLGLVLTVELEGREAEDAIQ